MWWRNPNPSKRLQPTMNQPISKAPKPCCPVICNLRPTQQWSLPPHHPPPKAELETWKNTRVNPIYPETTYRQEHVPYIEQEEPKTHLQSWNCFYKSALSLWYCEKMEVLARAESAILEDGSHRGTARQPKSWNAIANVEEFAGNPRRMKILWASSCAGLFSGATWWPVLRLLLLALVNLESRRGRHDNKRC